ncbi:HAD family acid phosphatase [Candidatus Margulisiibacteriota bacterium]
MKRKTVIFAIILIFALTPVASAKYGNSLKWVQKSAEYELTVLQIYTRAGNWLKYATKELKPGSWCVLLDLDETILNNARFYETVEKGFPYSERGLYEWYTMAKSIALPGSAAFCSNVKKLGGKVVILSDRKAPLKEPTERNLKAEGIVFDLLLLQEGGYAGDDLKNQRRADVQKSGLRIVMRVGDQLCDFYDTAAYKYSYYYDRFGRSFVIIPNPIYGEWENTK